MAKLLENVDTMFINNASVIFLQQSLKVEHVFFSHLNGLTLRNKQEHNVNGSILRRSSRNEIILSTLIGKHLTNLQYTLQQIRKRSPGKINTTRNNMLQNMLLKFCL